MQKKSCSYHFGRKENRFTYLKTHTRASTAYTKHTYTHFSSLFFTEIPHIAHWSMMTFFLPFVSFRYTYIFFISVFFLFSQTNKKKAMSSLLVIFLSLFFSSYTRGCNRVYCIIFEKKREKLFIHNRSS